MKELHFYRDDEDDVGEFMNSLGDFQIPVLEDLVIIASAGPESLRCAREADQIWRYDRSLGGGRRVILLFVFLLESDSYLVLHGVRAGPTGLTRSDIRTARRRRGAFSR